MRCRWMICWAILVVVSITAAVSRSLPAAEQTLQELQTQLKSTQASQRAAAAKQLSDRGTSATSSLESLRASLSDADPMVRVRVAEAVWHISGKLDEALPVLFEVRNSDHADARKLVKDVLAEVGPNARAALTLVVEQAKLNRNQPEASNERATAALIKLGLEVVPAIVDQFDVDLEAPRARADGQPEYNYNNNQNIERLLIPAISRQGAAVVPTLKVLLRDDNAVVRGMAAETLSDIPSATTDSIPLLIPMLDDRDSATRLKVLIALLKMGPQNAVVLESAARVLRDHKDQALRLQVVNRLLGTVLPSVQSQVQIPAAIQIQGTPLVEALRVALRDPDGNVRLSAANVLMLRSLHGPEGVAVILGELKSRQYIQRQRAATLLAKFPAEFQTQAVTHLQSALRDPHFQVRISAMAAAKTVLTKEQFIPLLRELASDDFLQVRSQVVDQLWELGEHVESLRGWVKIVESGGNNYYYTSLTNRIQQLGKFTPEMEALLVRALKSSNQSVQQQVLQLFVQTPPQTEATVEYISNLAETKSPVQATAIQVLGRTRVGREKQLPRLLALLKADKVEISTISALGELGAAAKPAVPRLVELLDSDQTENGMRRQLIQVIAKLSPDSEAAAAAIVKQFSSSDSQTRSFAANYILRFGVLAIEPVRKWLRSNPSIDQQPDQNRGLITPHRSAFQLLAAMGTKAAPALPELMAVLPKVSGTDREVAMSALREIGRPTRDLMREMLKSSDVESRRLAAEYLRTQSNAFDEPTETRAALQAALKDDDARVRMWAVAGLCAMNRGTRDPKWVELIRSGIRSEDAALRPIAAGTFHSFAGNDPALLAAARAGLKDPDRAVYLPLAAYLARVMSGDDVVPLLPRLFDDINSQDMRAASAAYNVILLLGPKAESLVPQLIELLKTAPRNQRYQAQSYAATLLGQIGPAAVPALKEMMATTDMRQRQLLVQSFGQMQKTGVPLLLELLKNSTDANQRTQALFYLLNEVNSSDEVQQLFIDGIKSSDKAVRLHTIQTLRNRAGLPSKLGPALLEQLASIQQQSGPEVDNELAQILGALSNIQNLDPKETLPPVMAAAKSSKTASVQTAAASTWAALDSTSTEPLSLLASRLSDPNPGIATLSIHALTQHAARCRTLLPQIKTALQHPLPQVRVDAARLMAFHQYETDLVMKVLLDELDAPNRGQTSKVFPSFALISKAAKPAIPKIIESAGGNEKYYAIPALVHLAADHPDAEAFVIDQVKHPDSLQFIMNGLLTTSPSGFTPKMLAAFGEQLNHPQYGTAFAQLLAAYDSNSLDKVTPRVMDVLQNDPSTIGMVTFSLPEAFRAIAAKYPDRHSELRNAFKSHSLPMMRTACARAVWHIDHNADEVLPVLVEDLQQVRFGMSKHWTIVTLGEMGPAAKPALSKLLALMHSLPLESQRDCIRVLEKIDPEATKSAGISLQTAP